MVYSMTHSITRDQSSNHQPVVITKPIDKSSPLLGMAITDNEMLNCTLDFYRTSDTGTQELYYTITLTDVTITDISVFYPHSVTHKDAQPQKSISLKYANIIWKHHIAGTSGYSIWEERVM